LGRAAGVIRIIRFVPGDRPMPDAGEIIAGADYLGVIVDAEFPQARSSTMKGLLLKCAGLVMAAAMLLPLAACDQGQAVEYYQKFQDYAAQGCKAVPALSYVGPIVDSILNTGGTATVISAAIKEQADKFCADVKAPSSMRTLMDSGEVMTEKGPVEVYRLE
jgi:hypothetical protein